jgi:hypothetical protein
MKPRMLPIIKMVSERLTDLEMEPWEEATRITAQAELKIIKRRLQELRAFLASESADLEGVLILDDIDIRD